MKQNTRWLTTALAVAAGLIITNLAQAQYILGNGASAGIAMGGGSFAAPNTTTATGLSLSGTGYNWGEWDIPTAQQQVYNPGDNEIIFNYTILSPTPGSNDGGISTTGGVEPAWGWYSLQPLIDTASGLVRYYSYDGYDLSYEGPGGGEDVANLDPGYVYNPANQTVTLTAPLTAAQQADIAGGSTVYFFQISMDGGESVPNGYSFNINYIELVPEPATMALFGLGLAGLVIARRRVSAR